MKEDGFLAHNTDKLLLLFVLIGCGLLILHVIHHGMPDDGLLAWVEHSFDVVLGALVLILTGRTARADGQTANGLPPTTSTPAEPPPAIHKVND